MNAARQLLLVLPVFLTGVGAAPQPALRPASPNNNRVAAGVLRDGVLTVALEVRRTMWHPDGDTLPGMSIEAFAEAGKDASVPGPLLRVPAGSEIRGSLRNALERDTITFYVAARVSRDATGDQLDALVVPPGETRDLRFSVKTPGTYLYRATSGVGGRRPVLRIEGFLAGALIVDTAGVAGTPGDRVLVLQAESDPLGSPESLVMAINGRSWPHTERLDATVGDTLRWRLINATTEFHPMHLHGFFYRVDAFNAEARGPGEGGAAPGRMVVTERMPPASTMSISWVPERAGNWLFHCHFQQHVVPHRPVSATASQSGAPSDHADHLNHALTGLGGLVMGILVKPKPGERIAEPVAGRRRLRLVAIRDAGFPDSLPSMRFVLKERGAGRLDAGPGFSPTISLT